MKNNWKGILLTISFIAIMGVSLCNKNTTTPINKIQTIKDSINYKIYILKIEDIKDSIESNKKYKDLVNIILNEHPADLHAWDDSTPTYSNKFSHKFIDSIVNLSDKIGNEYLERRSKSKDIINSLEYLR